MPSDSTYQIGKLANANAYTSDTLDGTGHIRVNVSAQEVKVDYVRAYLPADTITGQHKNGEVAFSYTVHAANTNINQSLKNVPSIKKILNEEYVSELNEYKPQGYNEIKKMKASRIIMSITPEEL